MNEETRALIKKLIEEGQRFDDVRRAVISQGLSTDGFEKEYPAIQKELGIKEPPPEKLPHHVEAILKTDMQNDNTEYLTHKKARMVSNTIKLVMGVLIIVVAAIVLSGYGSALKDKLLKSETFDIQEGLNATDLAHEAKMKSMRLSAQNYKNRLTDYSGLCGSIGIDREVYSCKENMEFFVIEIQLSNGSYYCADDTGFVGITEVSSGDEFVCPQ